MKISDTIRALLNMHGMRQSDLVVPLGMKSAASLNNKFSYDRWDGKDLIKIAHALGCRLGFQLPNGDIVYFDHSDYVKEQENG